MDGAVVLRLTALSVPSAAVFVTANALLARLAAGARTSSKVMSRSGPSTHAEATVGAVVSTGRPLMAICKASSSGPHDGSEA